MYDCATATIGENIWTPPHMIEKKRPMSAEKIPFDNIFEDTSFPLLLINSGGRIKKANRAARDAFDITNEDTSITSLWNEASRGGEDFSLDRALQQASGGSPVTLEVPVTAMKNPQHWRKITLNPLETEGEIQYILVEGVSGISDRPGQSVSEVLDQLHRDHVTGLPDRLRFMDTFEKCIASHEERNGFFTFADIHITNLHRITTLLGVREGDQVLQTLGQRLRSVSEPGNAGRLAGAHFGLLLPDLDGRDRDTQEIWESILDELKQPIPIGGTDINPSIKIGVVHFPVHGEDPEELLVRAHSALSTALTEQGSQVQQYLTDMPLENRDDFVIEQEFRTALNQEDLNIVYQPIIDLPSGGVRDVEVLVRWNHPMFGDVSPAEIINLARTQGLMGQLGTYIIDRAVDEWSELPPEHRPGLSVNVSAVEFLQKERTLERMDQVFDEGILAPENLQLEITEDEVMQDIEFSRNVMEELVERGIRIALDDFGTGYSSLAYLNKFPLEVLKVDKDMLFTHQNPVNQEQFLEGVVKMLKAMDLEILVEGIETEEQLELIKTLGVDAYQGFLSARPVSIEILADFLETQEVVSRSSKKNERG